MVVELTVVRVELSQRHDVHGAGSVEAKRLFAGLVVADLGQRDDRSRRG